MKALLVIAFFGWAFSVDARLGESRDDLRARYGKPVSVATNGSEETYRFRTKDYDIKCITLRGKCAQEVVQRRDQKPIEEDELLALMRKIGGEKRWTILDRREGTVHYVNRDGTVSAFDNKVFLSVITSSFLNLCVDRWKLDLEHQAEKKTKVF